MKHQAAALLPEQKFSPSAGPAEYQTGLGQNTSQCWGHSHRGWACLWAVGGLAFRKEANSTGTVVFLLRYEITDSENVQELQSLPGQGAETAETGCGPQSLFSIFLAL